MKDHLGGSCKSHLTCVESHLVQNDLFHLRDVNFQILGKKLAIM